MCGVLVTRHTKYLSFLSVSLIHVIQYKIYQEAHILLQYITNLFYDSACRRLTNKTFLQL